MQTLVDIFKIFSDNTRPVLSAEESAAVLSAAGNGPSSLQKVVGFAWTIAIVRLCEVRLTRYQGVNTKISPTDFCREQQ